MPPAPSRLTIRPLSGPGELDLFRRLSYVLDHELADDLATGRRLPEWMWVALDGGRVVARAAWWTNAPGGEPLALDFFDLDDALPAPERIEIGVRLLERATEAVVPAGARRPEYGRFVPPDWREDPVAREAVGARIAAVEATGARMLVERLRLEWRAGTPVPGDSGRLVFRPVTGREDLLALMTPVMEGTLDAHGQEDLASGLDTRAAAEKHYDEELAGYSTPMAWWRIAELPTGEPVGFVIPARNNYHPIIAYIGVLPARRGHGYIDDLLAEGTRVLAAEGVDRIRAATDLGNVPMAKSFDRLGYVNFERAFNMVWDAEKSEERTG
ncbi:GNAT family N-acetyltransferase [Streptomyces sp. ATCC51928]|uniref:GNAT family N-acetyltransferase n=1 Tax=Streptomyces caviscabies TaxID=90079 RepID=A0ABW2MEE0_9ACTN|nr:MULTISPECIES: GNAT family N-acetyltransferase [unclassified Streptomyces]MDX3341777.1 GNAT family N-acetyltransferase [Streptomyces sp. ME02-6979.5a]MDX3502006.1 GNAT family N-acetyltransferase [Streptomyces sp. ATCC51928]MDX5522874.1 GNAT family N-acetyltransferase [Streptomyces sp. DE06-01C]